MRASESIIQPKTPKSKEWISGPAVPQAVTLGYPALSFMHPTGLYVISAVEVTKQEPGAEALGPEYHISISKRGGRRCTMQEAKWVLRQFDCDDAEEDNHVPNGIVRNFWRPVADKFSGYQCPCKAAEPAMKEDKGDYVWRGVTR